MKKLLATLIATTMALSAVGGLVACGDDETPPPSYDDPFNKTITGTWSVPEETYWVAATLKYYDNETWGADAGETNVPADFKFQQNSDNTDLYKITLNLYKGDIFKIRYSDNSWDASPGISKLTADENLLPSLNTASSPIGEESGEGLGGKNFTVYQDGVYELRINTAPTDKSIVTYVRTGDAPVLKTDYVVCLHGQFGGAAGWADSTEKSTEVLDAKADSTHTFTKALAVNDVFGIRVMARVTKGTTVGEYGQSAWVGPSGIAEECAGIDTTGDNIKCTVAGSYTFTVVLNADGVVQSAKITPAAAA